MVWNSFWGAFGSFAAPVDNFLWRFGGADVINRRSFPVDDVERGTWDWFWMVWDGFWTTFGIFETSLNNFVKRFGGADVINRNGLPVDDVEG